MSDKVDLASNSGLWWKYGITNIQVEYNQLDININTYRHYRPMQHSYTLSVLSDGIQKLSDAIQMHETVIKETEIREQYPTVQAAWESYQLLLNLHR